MKAFYRLWWQTSVRLGLILTLCNVIFTFAILEAIPGDVGGLVVGAGFVSVIYWFTRRGAGAFFGAGAMHFDFLSLMNVPRRSIVWRVAAMNLVDYTLILAMLLPALYVAQTGRVLGLPADQVPPIPAMQLNVPQAAAAAPAQKTTARPHLRPSSPFAVFVFSLVYLLLFLVIRSGVASLFSLRSGPTDPRKSILRDLWFHHDARTRRNFRGLAFGIVFVSLALASTLGLMYFGVIEAIVITLLLASAWITAAQVRRDFRLSLKDTKAIGGWVLSAHAFTVLLLLGFVYL